MLAPIKNLKSRQWRADQSMSNSRIQYFMQVNNYTFLVVFNTHTLYTVVVRNRFPSPEKNSSFCSDCNSTRLMSRNGKR